MPRLIRLVIRSYIVGFILALVFTAALIAMDVAHLRHLVMAVDGGFLAAFLLFFFSGIVFAGAQAGIAVFLMAEREETPRGGRPARGMAPQLIPVPLPTSRHR